MSLFGSSIHIDKINDVLLKIRDDLLGQQQLLTNIISQPEDLSYFTINASPTLNYSNNLLNIPCYLLKVSCDILTDGPSVGDTIDTLFYDTSGVPTGTEQKLFGFITPTQFVKGGGSFGYTQHNLDFPNPIYIQNGLGVICQRIVGTPTITKVNATFWYKPV